MVTKEKDNIEDLTLDMINTSFNINTFGPFLLTQALLPNVLAARGPRHIAVMSSRVGSIGDNTSGGYLSYRASKTAVNSLFKSIALDLREKEVVVSMLHPGFTKTNLDPDIWKIQGVVEPEEAASKLWKLLQSKGMGDTGKFWHRDGMELPW
jgi:NAD(P)-dependent dehydrogenase (short-subunit alcohol dehydrogenase family)